MSSNSVVQFKKWNLNIKPMDLLELSPCPCPSCSLWRIVHASSIIWPTNWRPSPPSALLTSSLRQRANLAGEARRSDASVPRAARFKSRSITTPKNSITEAPWKVLSKVTRSSSSSSSLQFSFDNVRGMLKEGDPTGAKWLCHPKAMQTYLSLLSSSQKDATLEACCGALQNLTASKDLVSPW